MEKQIFKTNPIAEFEFFKENFEKKTTLHTIIDESWVFEERSIPIQPPGLVILMHSGRDILPKAMLDILELFNSNDIDYSVEDSRIDIEATEYFYRVDYEIRRQLEDIIFPKYEEQDDYLRMIWQGVFMTELSDKYVSPISPLSCHPKPEIHSINIGYRRSNNPEIGVNFVFSSGNSNSIKFKTNPPDKVTINSMVINPGVYDEQSRFFIQGKSIQLHPELTNDQARILERFLCQVKEEVYTNLYPF